MDFLLGPASAPGFNVTATSVTALILATAYPCVGGRRTDERARRGGGLHVAVFGSL